MDFRKLSRKGKADTAKLDAVGVLDPGGRYSMHSAALGALAHKGPHKKLLAATLAHGLNASSRDWSDSHCSSVGPIDKFHEISSFRERTCSGRSASSAITHLKKPPVSKIRLHYTGFVLKKQSL